VTLPVSDTFLNKHSSSHSLNSVSSVQSGGTRIQDDDETYFPGIVGPIWVMKFNEDGSYLAIGGQDTIVRVYSYEEIYNNNNNNNNNPSISTTGSIGNQTGIESIVDARKVSITSLPPTSTVNSKRSTNRHSQTFTDETNSRPSAESTTSIELLSPVNPRLISLKGSPSQLSLKNLFKSSSNTDLNRNLVASITPSLTLFNPIPIRFYRGHTGDILDLSFSRNNFLVSSSMDKTVRLWHLNRKECLACFQHQDFVTSIRFHPSDDRYFVSGSLDSKIRVWSIPEKKVKYWNELSDSQFVTAVAYTKDGTGIIAGTYNGDVLFYDDVLKYNTQISVKTHSRTGRGKGAKVTGIEIQPGKGGDDETILITSNDSKLRLYNLRDKSLSRKFKGLENANCQIRASFSDDGKYILCGSEDKCVYVWNTEYVDEGQQQYTGVLGGLMDWGTGKTNAAAKDSIYERWEVGTDIVTCALAKPGGLRGSSHLGGNNTMKRIGVNGMIIVCGDYKGRIKVYLNELSSSNDHLLSTTTTTTTTNNNNIITPGLTMTHSKSEIVIQPGLNMTAALLTGISPTETVRQSINGIESPSILTSNDIFHVKKASSSLRSSLFTPVNAIRRNSRGDTINSSGSNSVMNSGMNSGMTSEMGSRKASVAMDTDEDAACCDVCRYTEFKLLKGGKARCLQCGHEMNI